MSCPLKLNERLLHSQIFAQHRVEYSQQRPVCHLFITARITLVKIRLLCQWAGCRGTCQGLLACMPKEKQALEGRQGRSTDVLKTSASDRHREFDADLKAVHNLRQAWASRPDGTTCVQGDRMYVVSINAVENNRMNIWRGVLVWWRRLMQVDQLDVYSLGLP